MKRVMNNIMKTAIKKFTILLLAMVLLALAACGANQGEQGNKPEGNPQKESPLDSFDVADMSGYGGLSDYSGPLPFVDVTVQDIHKLMEDGETFVIFISFERCPWCNAVIKYFSEVAAEYADSVAKVAYLNTRRNPEWKSNLEIDDYDLFVRDFDEYLDYDSEGIKHLYVPHVFFIKDGRVVYEHQGALASMGSDPETVLTDAMKEELRDLYREGFKLLQ